MSRITIEVTEQQHQSIKALAALQGKSIKEYAVERLFGDPADEELAMQELKTMLASRIAAGLRGEVSGKSITDIGEEVIQSGGRE